MNKEEIEYLSYEFSGILESRGSRSEIALTAEEAIARIRRKYPRIDAEMKVNKELYDIKFSGYDPSAPNGSY